MRVMICDGLAGTCVGLDPYKSHFTPIQDPLSTQENKWVPARKTIFILVDVLLLCTAMVAQSGAEIYSIWFVSMGPVGSSQCHKTWCESAMA